VDWGKNRFGPILATPSPDAWQRLLRRAMRRKLRQILIRHHGPFASPTSRSRYRITFVWDITTLLKVGELLGLADLFSAACWTDPPIASKSSCSMRWSERTTCVCRWIFTSASPIRKRGDIPA